MAVNAAEDELWSETSSSDISGQEYVGVYSDSESVLTRSTIGSFSTSNEHYEVTESVQLRIEGDGGSDGPETIVIQCRDRRYLKLDRSDGRPYVIKVYDNLPPTDRNNPEYSSWPDYKFNYTASKSVKRGGFLEVSSLYVTLDADSSPKKLKFVLKFIHMCTSQEEVAYIQLPLAEGEKVKMQFFNEKSKAYEWFEDVIQYFDKRTKIDSDESDIEFVE